MKHTFLMSLLASSLAFNALAADPAAAPATEPAKAAAPDPTRTLVTVNGAALPAIYGSFIKQSRANRGAPPESMSDEAIREQVINVELLSQEALRKELDKKPLVTATLEFQRKELLGQAAIEEFARSHPISDDVIKAEYDSMKTKAGENEYRPRHILVPTEKEARDIIAKLAGKKAKFEDLAKKQSKDSSAGNGGDLGWTVPANLVPEFADAMVKMKKGEISKEPVKTEFGWHVVQIQDLRKLDFPTFDKLKGRIGGQLQQQQLRKYVQELRATAKVE